ncbi:hypothetical protein FNV43_RR16949 [Rhamnella rubrinervis]|uniref:Uncharacterized protein n=1 Tax=Rhamnella rubrinervis TaxID=2594499 RepID=A0A8K0GZW4_9ROSA|nr:hypothetical protein FNV43_RR16949 [Rhamnella rubrinervis]
MGHRLSRYRHSRGFYSTWDKVSRRVVDYGDSIGCTSEVPSIAVEECEDLEEDPKEDAKKSEDSSKPVNLENEDP